MLTKVDFAFIFTNGIINRAIRDGILECYASLTSIVALGPNGMAGKERQSGTSKKVLMMDCAGWSGPRWTRRHVDFCRLIPQRYLSHCLLPGHGVVFLIGSGIMHCALVGVLGGTELWKTGCSFFSRSGLSNIDTRLRGDQEFRAVLNPTRPDRGSFFTAIPLFKDIREDGDFGGLLLDIERRTQ